MSIKIKLEENRSVTLEELVDQLESIQFDPTDQKSLITAAPLLKSLANNPSFLGDYVIEQLEQDFSNVSLDNNYVPQVILLKLDQRKGYIIRANFWPAVDDSVYKSSGASAFSYGLAHDHNFNFLTVGYFGPGYMTDIYEYDYDSVSGYSGEKVDMVYCGQEYLSTGDVMLYRAHRDIHIQHPPSSMSISLNLMESSRKASLTNQYEFDISSSTIKTILNENRLQALISSAALLEPEGCRQILKDIADKHPNDRVKFEAIKVRACSSQDYASSLEILEKGACSESRMVRESCRQYRTHLEQNPLRIGSKSNELLI